MEYMLITESISVYSFLIIKAGNIYSQLFLGNSGLTLFLQNWFGFSMKYALTLFSLQGAWRHWERALQAEKWLFAFM